MMKKALCLVMAVAMLFSLYPAVSGINSQSIDGVALDNVLYGSVNKIVDREGNQLIGSESYSVEKENLFVFWDKQGAYLESKQETGAVVNDYKCYSVEYIQLNGTVKSTVKLTAEEPGNYRIKWTLTDIAYSKYTEVKHGYNFTDSKNWVYIGWEDAVSEWGKDVAKATYDKGTLTVVFSLGYIEKGETVTLDPVVVLDENLSLSNLSDANLRTLHPSASSAYSAVSQSFTPSETSDLYSAAFFLRKVVGKPTGNAVFKVYNHSGVYGTSSLPNVLLATSETLNVATLPAGYAEITLNFTGANRITLTAGTRYVLVFENPGAGTMDAVNYIRLQHNNANTHGGNMGLYSNGAWAAFAAFDARFIVNGASFEVEDVTPTSAFSTGAYGWVNVTVTDPDGRDHLTRVDLNFTDTDANNVILRWTQVTDTFSEVADAGNICEMMDSVSEPVDWYTVKVCFHFRLGGTTGEGDVDAEIYVLNDAAANITAPYPALFSFTGIEWGPYMDIIESVFSLFGINDWASSVTAGISAFAASFGASLANMVTLILLQLQVIWNVYDWGIDWATRIINTVTNFGAVLRNILNGDIGSVNLWTYFNFANIIDAVPVFLIVYWIDSMTKRARTEGALTVLYGDLQTFTNIFAYFFGIFGTVVEFVEGKINWLINALT